MAVRVKSTEERYANKMDIRLELLGGDSVDGAGRPGRWAARGGQWQIKSHAIGAAV